MTPIILLMLPNKLNSMKKNIILHPWLLAMAPILSLYEHNKDATNLDFLILPLIISLISAGLLFILNYLITKNKNKAALISSIFILLFFLLKIGFSFSLIFGIFYNLIVLSTTIIVLFIFRRRRKRLGLSKRLA